MADTSEGNDSPEATTALLAKIKRNSRNRASNDPVAELEAELRRAYVTKELQTQIIEREAQRYVESVRERETAELMRLEEQVSAEEDLRRRQDAWRRCEEYRQQLNEQMTRKAEEKIVSAEEASRERRALEELDRAIEECERARLLELKLETSERCKREWLIQQEMREMLRQREQELEEKKRREDLEYSIRIDRRREEAERMRKELAKNRSATVERIARLILAEQAEKREREELIAELVSEDVILELSLREEAERRRRRAASRELARVLEEQIIFTEQCKLRFVEEDRAFAEEITRKIMEDGRAARLTAEARRRMQLRHRESLARLIEERRRIRELEIARIEQEARQERIREQERREHEKEERRRLLEEHAANVADFVNRGSLDPEERTIVQESLKHDTNRLSS